MGRTFTFTVGNKDYTLKFEMNTVCDIEEAAGRTPIQALLAEDRIGYNTIRLLVQYGLQWRHTGITKRRAGELIEQYVAEGKLIGDNKRMETLSRETLTLLAKSMGSEIKKEDIDEAVGTSETEEEDKTE